MTRCKETGCLEPARKDSKYCSEHPISDSTCGLMVLVVAVPLLILFLAIIFKIVKWCVS